MEWSGRVAGGGDSLTGSGARGAGMSTAFQGGSEGGWCRGTVGLCADRSPPREAPLSRRPWGAGTAGVGCATGGLSRGESVHRSLAGFARAPQRQHSLNFRVFCFCFVFEV